MAANGWNWGEFELLDSSMVFGLEDKEIFELKYDDIALVGASATNEVVIELNTESADKTK